MIATEIWHARIDATDESLYALERPPPLVLVLDDTLRSFTQEV